MIALLLVKSCLDKSGLDSFVDTRVHDVVSRKFASENLAMAQSKSDRFFLIIHLPPFLNFNYKDVEL